MVSSFTLSLFLLIALVLAISLALSVAWMFKEARRTPVALRKIFGNKVAGEPQGKPWSDEFSQDLVPQPGRHRFDSYLPPLPAKYGEDVIALLVRSPYSLYAYWEVSPGLDETVSKPFNPLHWKTAPWLLRLYDISETSDLYMAPFTDIPIPEWADNWNIHIVSPVRGYRISVGRVLPTGFVSLLTSTAVWTPADSPSDVIDPNWPPILELQGYRNLPAYVPSSPTVAWSNIPTEDKLND